MRRLASNTTSSTGALLHHPSRHTRPRHFTQTGMHPDLVWMYRTPLPESQKIAGLACFYNERVELFIDGEALPRPVSPFS